MMNRALAPFVAALAPALLLAGCDDPAAGPGGMAEADADRLEAAAERLDARPPSPAAADADALEAEVREGIDAERAALAEERGAAEAR